MTTLIRSENLIIFKNKCKINPIKPSNILFRTPKNIYIFNCINCNESYFYSNYTYFIANYKYANYCCNEVLIIKANE